MNPKHTRIINNGIVTLAFISLMLGIAGWYDYLQQLGREVDFWSAFYNSLKLFTLNSDFESIHLPLVLNIARFTAPASLAGAIIIGVLMLTRNGLSYLRIRFTFRKHLIICGYSRRAKILIKDLISTHQGVGIVVIDEHLENTGDLQWKKLIFLKGNPASARMLQKAGIKKASYILLLDNDPNDLRNLDQLRKINFQGKVILHLTDPHITGLYKEISRQLGLAELHVISDAGILANRIIDQYSPDQYVSIKSPSDPQAHIIFCGDDPLLTQLIREAGIMYQFANLKKPYFTIAVPEIHSFRETINKQLPQLHEAVDFTMINIQDLFRPGVFLKKENSVALSIICFQEFAYTAETGRRLRQALTRHNGEISKPEILLVESLAENQYAVEGEILEKIKKINLSYCSSLRHFSTQNVIHDFEKYDIIAKFIHNGFSIREENDFSDAERMWERLSDAEKDWNRWPARHFHIKLRAIGAEIVDENHHAEAFELDAVSEEKRNILARMEKNRWNAEKWLTGYVPGQYQDNKDFEKFLKNELKVHPALKPWEDVSGEERKKDTYAFNDIKMILGKAGLKIIKSNENN